MFRYWTAGGNDRITLLQLHKTRNAMISKASRLYRNRLLGNLGSKDPFRVLRRTPKELQILLDRVPPKRLLLKLTTASWSITEIVAHLAETELVLGWRYRSIAERSGIPIQSFDQNVWCTNARYGFIPIRESLAMFTVLRSMNIKFLTGLPDRVLSYYGMHDERGKETLRQIIRLEAGHDLNHLMQIQKIIRSANTIIRNEKNRKK